MQMADNPITDTCAGEPSWATTYPLGKPGFSANSQLTPLVQPVVLNNDSPILSLPLVLPFSSFKSIPVAKPKHPPRIV